MATSGTVGATTLTVNTLLEHAARRVGIPTGEITAEMGEIAKNSLYFYLTNLGNAGVNLWTVERRALGVVVGQRSITLPVGTIDVLNANWRTLSRVLTGSGASSAGGIAANAFDADVDTYCQQTSPNGNISYDFGADTRITTIGLMTYGAVALTPVFEYSSDGTTWANLYTPTPDGGATTIQFTDKVFQWWDITTTQSCRYIRLRETGGATLAVRELFFGNTPVEITMARLNRDDYSNLPNKDAAGNPLQFYVDRMRAYPVMNLWQVPNNWFGSIVVYRHRHIEDVTALIQEVEVPQRWHNALVCALAASLAIEVPGIAPEKIAMLDQMSQRATNDAANEERDASPIFYTPGITVYTR